MVVSVGVRGQAENSRGIGRRALPGLVLRESGVVELSEQHAMQIGRRGARAAEEVAGQDSAGGADGAKDPHDLGWVPSPGRDGRPAHLDVGTELRRFFGRMSNGW
jgi:hypothetical protein